VEPLAHVFRGTNLVGRYIEREELAQARRLDLDPSFRVLGFIEGQYVVAEAIADRLSDPLDPPGQIIAAGAVQPLMTGS
jgi:hypothetical protein